MKNTAHKSNIREFLTKSAFAAAGLTIGTRSLSAKEYRKVQGAGEKIRMGFIGLGNRGSQLLKLFMSHPDVEISAFCDLYEP